MNGPRRGVYPPAEGIPVATACAALKCKMGLGHARAHTCVPFRFGLRRMFPPKQSFFGAFRDPTNSCQLVGSSVPLDREILALLVGISTTECSEAPSVTRKVAMEKTSAKYQPPQMPSGSVPNFGERGTCASRVSQILLILLIMCLKKLSRRFCFRHIIYKKNGERPQRRYGFWPRKALFCAVIAFLG